MENLPKVILNRKTKLNILESIKYPEDKKLARKLYNKCDRERKSFIKLCIKYRLPYEKIGEILGVSKARIFQINHYGGHKLNYSDSKIIYDRDGNRCLICRKERNEVSSLHVHHIGNPKNKKSSNLITLCPACHRRVEATKRRTLTKV